DGIRDRTVTGVQTCALRSRAEAKKSTDTRQKEPDSRAKAAAAATAPSGENEYHIADPGEFARNMVQVGIQSQRLLSDFLKNQARSEERRVGKGCRSRWAPA